MAWEVCTSVVTINITIITYYTTNYTIYCRPLCVRAIECVQRLQAEKKKKWGKMLKNTAPSSARERRRKFASREEFFSGQNRSLLPVKLFLFYTRGLLSPHTREPSERTKIIFLSAEHRVKKTLSAEKRDGRRRKKGRALRSHMKRAAFF